MGWNIGPGKGAVMYKSVMIIFFFHLCKKRILHARSCFMEFIKRVEEKR